MASLVCALVGLFTFALGAVPAVICGHLARRETRTGRRSGDGLALAGLIIGWVEIALGVLVLMLLGYLLTGNTESSTPQLVNPR